MNEPLTPNGLTEAEVKALAAADNLRAGDPVATTVHRALSELARRRRIDVAIVDEAPLDAVRSRILRELVLETDVEIASPASVMHLARAYAALYLDPPVVDTVEPLHRGHDAAHWYADLLEMNSAVDHLLTVTSRFGLDDFGGRLEDVAEAINTLAATRKALA